MLRLWSQESWSVSCRYGKLTGDGRAGEWQSNAIATNMAPQWSISWWKSGLAHHVDFCTWFSCQYSCPLLTWWKSSLLFLTSYHWPSRYSMLAILKVLLFLEHGCLLPIFASTPHTFLKKKIKALLTLTLLLFLISESN